MALSDEGMLLTSRIIDFRDSYGFVTDYYDHTPSGNAILFTCHYLEALYRLGGGLTDIYSGVDKMVKQTEVQRGVVCRHPTKRGDYQSHDDLIGLISVSQLAGHIFAKDHYNYMLETGFVYDNLIEGYDGRDMLNNNFARIPGYRALVNICVHKHLSMGEMVSFGLMLMMIKFRKKSDTSGVLKEWHMVNAFMRYQYRDSERYGILLTVCKYWQKKVMEKWGGIGQVMGQYFKYDHPIAKAMRNQV